MIGPIDSMPILQWTGVLLPSIAVGALFIRLGSLLKTVQRLEQDIKKVGGALAAVTTLTTSLNTWREADRANREDLMERVRRLEDLKLR